MSRVFTNGPGDLGFSPKSSHTKDSKSGTCLTLSTIRWGSRVKWSYPENEVAPSPTIGVVVIEKGAFGSASTKVANYTFTYWNQTKLIKLTSNGLLV